MIHPTGARAGLAGALAVSLMMAGATRPARAQADADHPPLAPARDVQVEYSVQPDGAPAPKTIEAWFTANGGMMRIDSPEGMGSTILNRTTRQVTIVLNKQKVYTQFDARNGIRNPFLLDLQMQYTRKGTARVAGVPCTEWGVVSGRGTATACVTDDGVILREDGVDGDGMKGRLEATRVIYGPLPASTFQPPAGYQMVTRHRVAPSHALGGGQPVTGGTAQSGR
ncbi:hypothetical protein AA12717_3462 [Gluconacetobacter sacchari DSM 12717]|uniref:DUF4412 domain-containing protein n=2 Tax=Gluconacetobacter sacchari TaxID=92759 RepID=A0A7W4IB51_9PROT|nr:DUF4412 domain-containing protein [Gluconacetobacter sacchari]GBQ30299.1 hypothetical protein AA12717_3462 [Gluconacetobacter sacchari DSM 12717]